MTIDVRKVPAHRGVSWLLQAAQLLWRRPRPVLGAGLLFVASLYALCLLFLLPAQLAPGEDDLSQLLVAMVPLFVVVVLALPVLLGGLMHVVREAASGREAHARDLFAPIRARRVGPLALLGAIQILLALASTLLVVALAGADYWREYSEALKAAMAGTVPVAPQPEHPLLLSVLQLVFNYVSSALLMFGVPLVLFAGVGVVDALQGSLRAALRNVGACLLAGMMFVAMALLSALLVSVVTAVLAAIGALVHAALGAALALLVGLAYGATLVAMLAAAGWYAWQDVFAAGSETTAAPAVPHRIEV